MLKLFGFPKRHDEVIGVEFGAEGVAFAHVQRFAGQQPRLVQCEFLPCEAGDDRAEILKHRVAKLNLSRLPCHLVLPPSDYNLLLGDPPKVPPEELAEALRWRIKDLIAFPVSEAVIDAFLLPEDSARGTTRMAYAVVAQRKTIEAAIALARGAQLSLEVIDIAEFALRNLAEACCDTQRGVALVKLGQGSGSLQILRNGNLYLSRQFNLPYNGGLLDDLPADALILELQRSLDYFERQLRQSPPSHVYICGENVTADKLTTEIKDSLPMSIQLLSPAAGLQIDEAIAEHTLSLCLSAVGAALRHDQVGVV